MQLLNQDGASTDTQRNALLAVAAGVTVSNGSAMLSDGIASAAATTGAATPTGDANINNNNGTLAELQALLNASRAEEERLLQELTKTQAERDELREENNELLLVGPAPRRKSSGDAKKLLHGHADVAAAAAAAAADGKTTETTLAAAAAAAAENEPPLTPEQLQAELLESETNVARLQLANSKLMDKVKELEKAAVKGRGKTTEQFEAKIQSMETSITTLQSEVEQWKKAASEAQDTCARIPVLEKEKSTIQTAFEKLRADYNAYMDEEGLTQLANAKARYQERCENIEDELGAAKHELEEIKSEALALRAEKKRLTAHVTKLEQALAQKLPQGAKQTSVNAQLQQEITILINENLEMREQVETLEKKLRAAEKDRRKAIVHGSSRPTSPFKETSPTKNPVVEKENENVAVSKAKPRVLGMFKVCCLIRLNFFFL